jgi:phosphate acyltransferase
MLTIAVDAMGADQAPKPEVEGAVRAARSLDIKVILVGRQDVVRQELRQHEDYGDLPIEIVNARDVVTMEDSAARAFRTKRDSSIRVAARLVRDGAAQGFVSAGNTGAVMATAKMVQGVVPGVDRPALVGILPTAGRHPVLLVDVGANVDCSPRMLGQFAVMAEVYSRVVLRRPHPRVGLLSIGEEEHKGNELTRQVTPLLKALNLNFIGNVEGGDIYAGEVDVIVCDGFIGNVVLKAAEAVAEAVGIMIRENIGDNLIRKLGYLLMKPAFYALKRRVDYAEYGGAPLLGVDGISIISHGRSSARAIRNAIGVAAKFAEGEVNKHIREDIENNVELTKSK